jgi:hypothetical protein
MALSVTEANTVTSKFFDSKKVSTQQVYEDDPFFNKIARDKRVVTRGGSQIQFPIRYRKLENADAVGSDTRVTFQTKTTRTAGVLDWKYYSADALVTWAERQQNKGKPQIVDLMADKEEELRQDMSDRLFTDLYTANPNGLGYTSLAEIVDSAGAYAGVDVSDASEWASQEDNSTTEMVLYGSNSLSYYMNTCMFGKFAWDIIVTTRNLVAKFESLVEPQKRYQDKETADAGFRNVTFHGVPFLGTPHMPADTLYGLCTKVFEFRVDPEWDMKPSEWTELFAAGLPRHMGKVVSLVCNLACKMRKVNFKATALDYTK